MVGTHPDSENSESSLSLSKIEWKKRESGFENCRYKLLK